MYLLVHKMNYEIFGKGREKILECFYRNRKIYFNEITRETKLTPNTTLQHLKLLLKNNLITSNKRTNNTFFKPNSKNPQIYSIFSYFDYKKLNSLPPARKRAITEFIDKLEVLPLISLIFGSTAKSTFEKKSDIDILLIYNKKETESKLLKQEIEATTGVNIQTFIIDYRYFKEQILRQEDNLITHAIKTGFVTSGHYLFYKEALK